MEELKTSQVKERIIETLIDSGGELFEFDPVDVQHILNQLEIQENYNYMLIEEIKSFKSLIDLIKIMLLGAEKQDFIIYPNSEKTPNYLDIIAHKIKEYEK